MEDGSSIFWMIAILFGVGLGIVRWMPRIKPHEEGIRNWAIGLGIVSGFVFFFAGILPSRQANEQLAGMIGVSALVGAGAGFVWFFVIASITFCYQYVIAPPFRLFASWKRRLSERRARRSEERRRLREQREWERAEPERQRSQQQAATAQKRREDARAECELLFGLHAAEITNRFSRQDFDAFVVKYMTDKHSPEDVERRAEQLRALIAQHREQVKPTPKFSNIRELADWFHAQKAEIEALPVDERMKRTLLANLNERNAELMTQLVGSMEPGKR